MNPDRDSRDLDGAAHNARMADDYPPDRPERYDYDGLLADAYSGAADRYRQWFRMLQELYAERLKDAPCEEHSW
jgi:hypothetical protein